MTKSNIIKSTLIGLAMTMSLVAIAALPTSKAEAYGNKYGYSQKSKETIVDIVLRNDGEFDVLQAAVVRAGLVDALSGSNQLTVFAPTDKAFVKTLGVANEAAAVNAVNTMDKTQLTNILLYHVTPGRRGAISVVSSRSYPTLLGQNLTRHEVFKAGIKSVNTPASNGLVHVINSVLIP